MLQRPPAPILRPLAQRVGLMGLPVPAPKTFQQQIEASRLAIHSSINSKPKKVRYTIHTLGKYQATSAQNKENFNDKKELQKNLSKA